MDRIVLVYRCDTNNNSQNVRTLLSIPYDTKNSIFFFLCSLAKGILYKKQKTSNTMFQQDQSTTSFYKLWPEQIQIYIHEYVY